MNKATPLFSHSYDREQVRFGFSYHLWAVRRGQGLAGNEPIHGKPKANFDPFWKEEAREAHLAMARVWLRRLKSMPIRRRLP